MLHSARVWELFRVSCKDCLPPTSNDSIHLFILLQIYGHEKVSVVNGGLDAWRRAQLPTEDAAVEVKPGNWKAKLNKQLVDTFEELVANQPDGYCVMTRLIWVRLEAHHAG